MESFMWLAEQFNSATTSEDVITRLKAEKKELRQQNMDLSKQNRQCELFVSQLRRENRELQKLQDVQSTDENRIKSELAELEKAYAELKTTVETQTSEMGALQFEIWLKDDMNKVLKDRVCLAEQLVQDLNVEMARVAAVVLIQKEIDALHQRQAPQTPDKIDMLIMEGLAIAQAPPPAQQVAVCVAPPQSSTPAQEVAVYVAPAQRSRLPRKPRLFRIEEELPKPT